MIFKWLIAWYVLHTLPIVAAWPSQHHFAVLKDKNCVLLQ